MSHALTAYRRNNECESTILRLVENWKKDLDCKKVVGVLSSDMSKAFDSLWSASNEKIRSVSVFSGGPKIGAILFLSAEKQGKIGIIDKSMVRCQRRLSSGI